MSEISRVPRLAITPGEPAGIGPDIVIRLLQEPLPSVQLVVIGNQQLLADRAQLLKLPLKFIPFDPDKTHAHQPGDCTLIDIPLHTIPEPGLLTKDNAHYVLDTLATAIKLAQSHVIDAIVTGPVHKGIINDAGIPFTGHTEFLAEKTNTEQVVMMLATEGLRVALATTHLPLKDVAAAITKTSLIKTIQILHHDLQTRYGILSPRILVAGLNPHAGENGHLGTEEQQIITPIINELRTTMPGLSGPYPADTLFTPKLLGEADAVLAMYHDQGLPVLKYKGFGAAVNVTLGLPIVRTSVDHGVALDLAGTHHAELGSLRTAIEEALFICKRIAQTHKITH